MSRRPSPDDIADPQRAAVGVRNPCWNVVGCVVVLAAAYTARSVALAGFGLDSLIEILASVVVIWQLRGVGRDRERTAMRIIGVAFLLLAGYIAAQSAYVLIAGARPHPSSVGIAWTAATVVAMLLLAAGKDRTGRELHNPVLTTEARVTRSTLRWRLRCWPGSCSTPCSAGGGPIRWPVS